jgi:hypothetical protein
MSKSMIFIAVCISIVSNLNGQPKTYIDDSKALDFYKSSQILISKIINPENLVGSIIFFKTDKLDLNSLPYLNVLPVEIKDKIEPKTIDRLVYHSMLSYEFQQQIKFLSIFSISSNKNSLLEVNLTDMWSLDSPDFSNNVAFDKNVKKYGQPLAKKGYTVLFCRSVQYSTLTTRIFSKSEIDLKAVYAYIDASGNQYNQNDDFKLKEIISYEAVDITDILKTETVITSTSKSIHTDPQFDNPVLFPIKSSNALPNKLHEITIHDWVIKSSN